jgi:hypothetical protein
MLRRVALVRTDVSEELSASRRVRLLLVKASVVPSSPILVTLMKEALSTSETSVLTRATQRNIPEKTQRLHGLHNASMAYTTPPWPTQRLHGLHNASMPYKTPPWPTQRFHGLHNASMPYTTPPCPTQRLHGLHNASMPYKTPPWPTQRLHALQNASMAYIFSSPVGVGEYFPGDKAAIEYI